ncbi:hypothetical protein [Tsukamurella strandjordii]|uniref:Uncharacterized protein n=1 Tax=Tsukamurella strandjordii TaxID=147577 RepID=A0AA90NHP6_9ACTN|nr:hypothetical protein [Tsukamurella strandjordii]MDP0398700.1 hypothetical protein [Tsukamurella strandjordii]
MADFLDAYGKPVQDHQLRHVREAYRIALGKVDADTLSWAASSYRAKQRGRAEQYQKSPQNWLNDELWTKEPTADDAIDKLVEECGTVGGVANRLGVAYNPPLRLDEIEDLTQRAEAYREHGAEWLRENRGKLVVKLREQGP